MIDLIAVGYPTGKDSQLDEEKYRADWEAFRSRLEVASNEKLNVTPDSRANNIEFKNTLRDADFPQ